MKKYIITLVLALGFSMGLNAQSDGFFSSSNNGYRNADIESQFSGVPALVGHTLESNQSAPLGSGMLLLAGMGLGYAALRKKD